MINYPEDDRDLARLGQEHWAAGLDDDNQLHLPSGGPVCPECGFMWSDGHSCEDVIKKLTIEVKMSDNILSPWRDGTPEGEASAALFDKVVRRLEDDAPESTNLIRASGFDGVGYIDSVLGDGYKMQNLHLRCLILALQDSKTLDLVDALAARVRLVCGR